MDYVVVTKGDMKTLDVTLRSIRKQINVNRIILVQSINGPTEQFIYLVDVATTEELIDQLIMEDKGLAYARKIGIEAVETRYFVFVDADVVLSDNWVQKIWPYMMKNNAIFGRLYRNNAHKCYLEKYELLSLPITSRMFTHNTIIETSFVKDWNPDTEMNAYEDYDLTQHIIKKNGSIRAVPVLGFHDHQGSDFKAALWGGAGARQTGRFKHFRTVLWSAFKIALGGVKRTFKMNNDWFAIYGFKQALGIIIGFVFYKKYLKKKVNQ